MEEFHRNFPGYEKVHEYIESQKLELNRQYQRMLFHEKYPNIDFNNIQKPRSIGGVRFAINDGCDRYINSTTHAVYLFDRHQNKWL